MKHWRGKKCSVEDNPLIGREVLSIQHAVLLPGFSHNEHSGWFTTVGQFEGAGESAAVFQPLPPENRYNLNINSINSSRSWIKKAVKHAHRRINYGRTLLLPLSHPPCFSLSFPYFNFLNPCVCSIAVLFLFYSFIFNNSWYEFLVTPCM